MKRIALPKWYRDISIAKKLYFALGIMAILIVMELLSLWFSITTLSSVRAYVGAEGLWSKAQKDAVYNLRKYAYSGDENDYDQYLNFLEVPLGDRMARTEMAKETPDLNVVRKGFIQGNVNPADVDGMIKLFRRFNNISYINKAIKIWTKGDSLISALQQSADTLHSIVTLYGITPSEKLIDALDQIDRHNIELTSLENDFSSALGEGARWLEGLILKILFFIAITVEFTGIILGVSVSLTITKGIKEIIRVSKKISEGDFTERASVFSKDEIGALSATFNEMTNKLEKTVNGLMFSEKKFKELFESSPYAIIAINSNGKILLVNNQGLKLFGYTEDEIVGQKSELIVPDRFITKHIELRNKIFTGSKIWERAAELELYCLRKDGKEFPVEISLSPLETEEGMLTLAAIRDITDRKNKDREIIKLANIVRYSSEGIISKSLDGKIISWNGGAEKIFGYKKDEIIGKKGDILYPEAIAQKEREIFQDVVKGKEVKSYETKRVKKNKKVIDVLITLSAIKDEKGNIIEVSKVVRDITDQKNAEKEIKQSQERFLKIFENNPIPMILTEMSTNKIRYANTLFLDTLGYAKEEVIGHTSEELNLIPPDEAARLVPLIMGYLKEEIKGRSIEELATINDEEKESLLKSLRAIEEMKNFEVKYAKKNGEIFPVLISFKLVTIADEKYIISSFLDISERKKADEKLLNYTKEIEEKNKEIEQFAYIASHDLQEPLRTITNYLKLFEKENKGNISKSSEEYMNFINGATSRMRMLIFDLLQYSRIGRNSALMEIDCNKLIKEVLADMDASVKESKAKIKIDQLPTIKAYSDLNSLFQNLLSNAIKFRKEEIPLLISITAESRPNEWVFAVEDNGIGIEEKYFEKLFKIFQRLHTMDEYPGSGIGLAQCKKIVELHEGKIWVESKPGIGSTFYFTISKNL